MEGSDEKRYRLTPFLFYLKLQLHTEQKAMWTTERSNLYHVHAQLEHELDEIARELSQGVPHPLIHTHNQP